MTGAAEGGHGCPRGVVALVQPHRDRAAAVGRAGEHGLPGARDGSGCGSSDADHRCGRASAHDVGNGLHADVAVGLALQPGEERVDGEVGDRSVPRHAGVVRRGARVADLVEERRQPAAAVLGGLVHGVLQRLERHRSVVVGAEDPDRVGVLGDRDGLRVDRAVGSHGARLAGRLVAATPHDGLRGGVHGAERIGEADRVEALLEEPLPVVAGLARLELQRCVRVEHVDVGPGVPADVVPGRLEVADLGPGHGAGFSCVHGAGVDVEAAVDVVPREDVTQPVLRPEAVVEGQGDDERAHRQRRLLRTHDLTHGPHLDAFRRLGGEPVEERGEHGGVDGLVPVHARRVIDLPLLAHLVERDGQPTATVAACGGHGVLQCLQRQCAGRGGGRAEPHRVRRRDRLGVDRARRRQSASHASGREAAVADEVMHRRVLAGTRVGEAHRVVAPACQGLEVPADLVALVGEVGGGVAGIGGGEVLVVLAHATDLVALPVELVEMVEAHVLGVVGLHPPARHVERAVHAVGLERRSGVPVLRRQPVVEDQRHRHRCRGARLRQRTHQCGDRREHSDDNETQGARAPP